VRLQNVDFQYHLSELPWPEAPHLHPSGEQILAYWEHVATALKLDVRLGTEVVTAEPRDGGWYLVTRHAGVTQEHTFDFAVAAVGQYTNGKARPRYAGEELFQGTVGTEREVRALEGFAGQRVVVVGFGKSALDMATLASEQGARVHHVFRTPRWVLPQSLLGLHSSWFIFNRFGSVMMTSWAHPTALERFLHGPLGFVVRSFWKMLAALVRWHCERDARGTGAEGLARVRRVLPAHPLLPDLRSATALMPHGYLGRVARAQIEPHHAEIARFEEHAVVLTNGERIDCDRVVLSVGSERPRFPFFPASVRALLESEDDGVQLYRHLVHPRIERLGFAGFNHGFLHVPAAEVGAQWLACVWGGTLELPNIDKMEASVERVRAWKRKHIAFEPSRSCAINTRYQQYLDILCAELGVSPYRKLPNVIAEVFARYGAADYAGVTACVLKQTERRRSLPLDA
ncbi:MAG: NAD(P)-binding domain-containing protein, partial [Myxococcaceae bacterium]|nr:NAD(P)-binding domain-containing protein [Myxococcaceae bacterium]